MANYIKDVGWLLDAAVVNLSESAVEAAIKANTDFQYQAGLRPKVIRISSGNCCEWCDSLEGEYEYPDVPPEVWQRHKNCNCVVEYDPGDGKRQNVHTKEWSNKVERERRIEFEKKQRIVNSKRPKSATRAIINKTIDDNVEADIRKQKSSSIRKAIRTYERRIVEHKEYIENPEIKVSNYKDRDIRYQDNIKKHWQHEIETFQKNIERRKRELRKRGEKYGEND